MKGKDNKRKKICAYGSDDPDEEFPIQIESCCSELEVSSIAHFAMTTANHRNLDPLAKTVLYANLCGTVFLISAATIAITIFRSSAGNCR